MIKFDLEPHPEGTSKKKQDRERLSAGEAHKFRSRYTSRRCEITGKHNARGRKNHFHIHHLRPVRENGRKCVTNLAYVSPEVHNYIHRIAFQISKNTGRELGEVVEELSKDAIQLGKLAQVLDGLDPEEVYKRELYIDSRRETHEEMIQRELELGELEG